MASELTEELMPIFVLQEPEFNDFDQAGFVKMQMITAARAEVHTFDGAPYGYYLVNDSRGERKILAYFDGPDINMALSHALEKDQAPEDFPSSLNTTGTPMAGPSLMSVPERVKGSLYCVPMTLDPSQHPDCIGLDYLLPVDTADTSVWFLCDDFRLIGTAGTVPGSWPSRGYKPWEVRRTVPIPQGRPTFNFNRIPERTEDEAFIQYFDGGAIYVRAFPEDHILAEVPCWDWRNGKSSTVCFPLPCVLAYAANMKLASQAYDGNLGLAIHGAGGVLYSYSRALAAARHVHTHSVFTIRLLHPDALKLAKSGLVRSFVSFSSHFPCKPVVNFTPAIYFQPSELDGSHCKWGLQVEGLTLLVPGRAGFERIRIDAIDGLQGSSFYATLDSASGISVLPASVVSEIQAKWLCNNPAINGGRPYCGPERFGLDSCDIVFTFRSSKDNTSVEFRCNAARFLRSNVQLPPNQLGALSPSPTATQLQQYRECPLKSSGQERGILGINFYWTAFVEHWGPAMGSAGWGREPPYIRLAPQRVIERGVVTCHDYQFTLPQGVAPRGMA